MKNFTVLSTAKIDGGAYRWIKLPDGSHRIEEWKGGKGSKPAGADWDEMLGFTPPITPAFAAGLGIPLSDITTAPPRLPAPAEMDDMLARDLADGLRELNEERRPDTPSPADLTAKDLREAISLGVKMAEADARLMLERKARQVAELDRRRPRLAWGPGPGLHRIALERPRIRQPQRGNFSH